MISHVYIGIRDFDRALAFYAPLMTLLDHELKFLEREHIWAGWKQPGVDRPLLLIGTPYDGRPAEPGNGPMLALLAPDRATVARCHATALANGGTDEGAPGLRPHYHPDYFGAYVRDPDGNKLCFCCHHPEP